jgi:hypothetical protein
MVRVCQFWTCAAKEKRNKQKMKKLMVLAALAAMASGCVMVGPSNAKSALTLDVTSPDTSFIDNSVQPVKKGTATSTGIICFVEGDSSLKAAMENGGITKIHHVDYKVKNILGVVGSVTTIVWGE